MRCSLELHVWQGQGNLHAAQEQQGWVLSPVPILWYALYLVQL